MLKYCLLAILFCLGLCYAKAQSPTDSSRNKFANKFASTISGDCASIDSLTQELSKFIYQYLFEIRNIRTTVSDRLICGQKTGELRSAFGKGIKEKFGNCVYSNYKKIIRGHYAITKDKSPLDD